MTTTNNMPVWARILLGFPITEDNHSQPAEEPSDSSAPAPNRGGDFQPITGQHYLMLLDQAIRSGRALKHMLECEVMQ